jgi:serine/threonine-protein kinase
VATLRAVQHSVIVPPARLNLEVSPELDAVVMRALERELAQRYQTAQELERALRECVLRQARSVDETDVGRFLRQAFAADAAGSDAERGLEGSAVAPQPPSSPESGPAASHPAPSPPRGAETVVLSHGIAAPVRAPGQKITVPMRVPRPSATGTATALAATAASPTLPTRRSRVTLFAGAGAGVAVLVAATILLALQTSSAGSPGDAPARPPQASAEATVNSAPAASQSVDRPRPTEGEGAPSETPPAAIDGQGDELAMLTVHVKPWAEVLIDGQHKGEVVGIREWALSPGRHVVVFRHPKKSWQKVVMLDGSARETVRFDATP